MTTVIKSIWHFFMGDTEKSQLLQRLLAKGVPEADATAAVQMCPRIVPSEGDKKEILLLQYMIDMYHAKEADAVKALLDAKGSAADTVILYNETTKRQKILQEFIDLGIPLDVAKRALEETQWNRDKAQQVIAAQNKKEMLQAKRAYTRARKMTHRLQGGKPKKAGPAKKQSKFTKHRMSTHKRSSGKKKEIAEIDDSDDDEAMIEQELQEFATSTSDEEGENAPATARGYHSSDDSDNMQEEKDAKRKAHTPTLSEKKKVFVLRRSIAVETCKPLAQALQPLRNTSGDALVLGLREIGSKAAFRSGAAAGFLELLAACPALLEVAIKALNEKAENRS